MLYTLITSLKLREEIFHLSGIFDALNVKILLGGIGAAAMQGAHLEDALPQGLAQGDI